MTQACAAPESILIRRVEPAENWWACFPIQRTPDTSGGDRRPSSIDQQATGIVIKSSTEIAYEKRIERRKKVDALSKLIRQAEDLKHRVGHAQFYEDAMPKSMRWETEELLTMVIKRLRACINLTSDTSSTEGN